MSSQSDTQHRLTLLRKYNEAYALGMPLVTDAVYDELWAAVRAYDPDCPYLYHTGRQPDSASYDTEHYRYLPSLNKLMSTEELQLFLTVAQHETILLTPKLHGMGGIYYPGKGYVTLGDGYHGTLVKGLPLSPSLEEQSLYPTRGEFVIPLAKFDPILGKSPNSAITGLINKACRGNLPPERLSAIEFVPFESLVDSALKISGRKYVINPESLIPTLLEYFGTWSKTYLLDGIVLTIANQATCRYLGYDAQGNPKFAAAWKPSITTKPTTVTLVDWNVSRTGRIVPTIHYEPVELCGSTNRRTTANNAEYVLTRGLDVGAQITIGKAGEIIPTIVSVEQAAPTVTIPTVCPSCGEPVHRSGVDIICTNPEGCINAAITKAVYFYSQAGMMVAGIGPAFFEELLADPYLFNLFRDKPWSLLTILSKNGNALLLDHLLLHPVELEYITTAIATFLRRAFIPTENVVAALGIRQVGRSNAKHILNFINNNVPMPKTSVQALNNFIAEYSKITECLEELQSAGYVLKVSNISCQSFSLTGEFNMTRDDIVLLLTSKGWEYHPTPKKDTSIMFVGYLPSGSSNKFTTAKKLAEAGSLQIKDSTELDKLINQSPKE